MTVGKRIKITRSNVNDQKGMTQKELGMLCKIDAANIRKYESGRQNPKYETTKKIAAALGVPISLIMGIQPFPDPFLQHPAILMIVCHMIDNDFGTNISDMSFTDKICAIDKFVAGIHYAHIDDGHHELTVTYKDLDDKASHPLNSDLEKLTAAFNSLNEFGQKKALGALEDLAKIAEYQKGFKK